jgi:tetratricopeptide (TPR) repeat protein
VSDPSPIASGWRAWIGGLLLIAAVTVAVYWPVGRNFFVWDDDRYIEGNVQLLHPAGLAHIWSDVNLRGTDAVDQYYPLTFTTFWFEYHFFGARPVAYHVDNVILHLAGAMVLWRILVRLKIRGAIVAAMLFAVHPVQVESVAWATERKNVLSGLLYFLALAAYLRSGPGRRGMDDETRDRGCWGWYFASLILLGAALLAKSVTASLPAVILLLMWWKRGRVTWRDILPLLPMFVVAAAMGCHTSWLERNHVGAVGPLFEFSWADRLGIAGRAVWFYLGKLIVPLRLAFIYPRWHIEISQRPWLVAFPICAVVAIVALTVLIRRTGRGPLTGMLFFVGTLTPALGFFNVYPMRFSFVADHFQYLAMIGPLVLLVAVLAKVLPREVAVMTASIAVGGCILLSNLQCRIYHDRLSLWQDTVAKSPDSPAAHDNLGQALLAAGKLDEAEAQFSRAIELNPQSPLSYMSMGYLCEIRGDWQRAVRCYTAALVRTPPSSEPVLHRERAEPYYRLGTAYAALAKQVGASGNAAAARVGRRYAIAALRNALAILPDYELARVNLGQTLAENGQNDAAIEQFTRALTIKPDSVFAHEDLGNVYLTQGKLDEALAQYAAVLRTEPDNAHVLNNVGTAYAKQGKMDKAIESFRAALAIEPGFELARENLERALRSTGATTR